jgi:hypothetical protein
VFGITPRRNFCDPFEKSKSRRSIRTKIASKYAKSAAKSARQLAVP